MPKIENEVKVIRVEYICDACGEGKMLKYRQILGGDVGHKCDKCGECKTLEREYPYNEYIKIS